MGTIEADGCTAHTTAESARSRPFGYIERMSEQPKQPADLLREWRELEERYRALSNGEPTPDLLEQLDHLDGARDAARFAYQVSLGR